MADPFEAPRAERRQSIESTQDPSALSMLRGRLLSAIASALQIWVALAGLGLSWVEYRSNGATPDVAQHVMGHAEHLFDGVGMMVTAMLGLVSLIASVASKLRDRRPIRVKDG